ncbi:MAG: RNA polymerase sigma factor [Bacteroidota bacterium]|nr:RNA polymerase sigma factor [Bacteroidota bacterium]MDP4229937.1 RNA polymerase sigma factor [Bacteroidota bacterium]MDP4235650.1 RNA polymerase sigma factor [Bacteroidota bacterium]
MADEHKSENDLIKDLRGSRKEAEKAFSELYSRYGQRIYAFILRMTSDRTASQDLLQETFVKFFNATKQDLVFTNPGGFMMMIARNLCLNWKRDEHPTLPLEEFLESEHEAGIERDELLNLVTVALELLEYEYREAFVLKYYQGYSYEEMSAITGSTVTALKKRVWRAKEKIRSTLKPYILELKN